MSQGIIAPLAASPKNHLMCDTSQFERDRNKRNEDALLVWRVQTETAMPWPSPRVRRSPRLYQEEQAAHLRQLLNADDLHLEMARWGMAGRQYPDEIKINLRNRSFTIYMEQRLPMSLNFPIAIAYASLLGAMYPVPGVEYHTGNGGSFMLRLSYKSYTRRRKPIATAPEPMATG